MSPPLEITVLPIRYTPGNSGYEGAFIPNESVYDHWFFNAGAKVAAYGAFVGNLVAQAWNNSQYSAGLLEWMATDWNLTTKDDILRSLADFAKRGVMEQIYGLSPFQATLYDPSEFGILSVSDRLSGGAYSPFQALQHYAFGNGAPMFVNINTIGLNVKSNDVKPLQDAIKNFKTPGTYSINGTFSYATAKDSWATGAYLGHITLQVSGTFTRNSDGSWAYAGQLTALPDIYDANPSNHRTPTGEWSTSILRNISGTTFIINIEGNLTQNFVGSPQPAASHQIVGNDFYGPNDGLTMIAVDDHLKAISGSDVLIGGYGNDVYSVYSLGNKVVEKAGQGTDTVVSSVNWALGDNIENLILDGPAVSGSGNGLNNSVIGNELSNSLAGGADSDYIVGAEGSDTIDGGLGDDRLIGAEGNDQIYGRDGVDRLDGGDGDDNLYGGAGADVLIGGAGLDYACYDDGSYGSLTLRLDAPQANSGSAFGDTYSGIEGIVAGSGNDVVFGDGEENWLYGIGGNDVIDGRSGSDYLVGGAGADTFRFSTALGAANIDTIADFEHGVDRILLHSSIFTDIGAALDVGEFGNTSTAPGRLIIYQQSSGNIFFDEDGAGIGAGPRLFAKITPGTFLDVNDFLLV